MNQKLIIDLFQSKMANHYNFILFHLLIIIKNAPITSRLQLVTKLILNLRRSLIFYQNLKGNP